MFSYAAAMAQAHLQELEFADAEEMCMLRLHNFHCGKCTHCDAAEIVLKCINCGKFTIFPESDCDACQGSGESYWSDDVYGPCMDCVGVSQICKSCEANESGYEWGPINDEPFWTEPSQEPFWTEPINDEFEFEFEPETSVDPLVGAATENRVQSTGSSRAKKSVRG